MPNHPIHGLVKDLGVALAVAVLAGSASAFFLVALDAATSVRVSQPWLLALLPVAGLVTGVAYFRWGSDVESGNNRILDEIHSPNRTVPLRMAPMVLAGTLLTHLCGGSAGREGTAVQMGGSLADQIAARLGLDARRRRLALFCGVAAGFASVFGTPLAGAVFAMEWATVGALELGWLLPVAVAALASDKICLAWGARHVTYSVASVPSLDGRGFAAVLVAGLAFGLAARVFSGLVPRVGALAKRIERPWLRPAVGGAVVAALLWMVGARYQGLGVPVLVESFLGPVPPWDFAVKLVLTALTVGVGFKGGEVTPLFFVGATLGNVLAGPLGLPFPLLAAVGFVSVFGAAARTPLSSTVMAMELFGAAVGPWAALGCAAARFACGSRGIYKGQRGGTEA